MLFPISGYISDSTFRQVYIRLLTARGVIDNRCIATLHQVLSLIEHLRMIRCVMHIYTYVIPHLICIKHVRTNVTGPKKLLRIYTKYTYVFILYYLSFSVCATLNLYILLNSLGNFCIYD